MNKIVSRDKKVIYDNKVSGSQKFLYRNVLGRVILKLLIRPFVSKMAGAFLSTRFSKIKVNSFIKKNNIDTSDYIMDDIHSFNDFFTRKIKDGKRDINLNDDVLISPCDSKLKVYKINNESVFCIKDAYYRVSDLVKDEQLAKEYENGYCFVFRLCVDDYHRYCYPDSGTKGENIKIKGVLHTVNPIALEKYNFYKTNSREYTILDSDHFGKLVQVEVGALMVGKIKNLHQECTYKKGEEKGMFLFGGSTIVLLVKDNIIIDDDILSINNDGDEAIVKYGQGIAKLKK